VTFALKARFNVASKKAKEVTVEITFKVSELEMLRDIFGVVMPVLNAGATKPEEMMSEVTIAEYVAAVSKRTKLEHALWKKIAKACNALGVVTGKDAPTYAVSAAHVPALHAYKLEE
jgi:hypothetical protein